MGWPKLAQLAAELDDESRALSVLDTLSDAGETEFRLLVALLVGARVQLRKRRKLLIGAAIHRLLDEVGRGLLEARGGPGFLHRALSGISAWRRAKIQPANQEKPMKKKARRNHSSALKAKVALAAIKGEDPCSAIGTI